MPERYKVVQHDTATYWIKNCHVILVSHAITKDNIQNKVFLQCKFENVGLKRIKALYIKVKCADISQKDLQGVDSFSYLDIDIEQYQTFGDKIPVYLPDKESRCITIIPVRIIFSDDSIWENTFETPFTLAEYEQKPIETLGKLEEQYKRELHKACDSSDKHKFLPIHKDGFIICGCGKILADDATTCPACGSDMEKLLEFADKNKLWTGIEQCNMTQTKYETQENTDNNNLDMESVVATNTSRQNKKFMILGCFAIVVVVLIVCGSIFLSSPPALEEITLLSDGSEVTLNGGYLMEVPCYSYGVKADDYDTEDKEFLCISLNIKNENNKKIDLRKLISGEIKKGKEKINDDIIFMGETKEETIDIPSYTEKDILIAFPVPKGEELKNLVSTLVIEGKPYMYINTYEDVRGFVRDMYEQHNVAVQIRTDISMALTEGAELVEKIQNSEGFMVYAYGKQFIDSTYEKLDDMQSRNRKLINAINELNAPDIPFYNEMQQAMIDDANETITKLEHLNDVDYPANMSNLNDNADAIVKLYNEFPDFGIQDMLTMGQHWIVDFQV